MAGFEREFIIHLQSVGEHNVNGLLKGGPVIKGKKELQNSVYRRLMKKYRRQWWGSGPAKKKRKSDVQETKNKDDGILENKEDENWVENNQTSWSQFHSGSCTSNSTGVLEESRKYNSSLMNSETHCTDFPITGIVQEFPGNRDNGNSPFNSSNSCGSPEGITSQEQSQVIGKQVSASLLTDTQFCEQNNNSQNIGCLCKESKQWTESQIPKVPGSPQQEIEATDEIPSLSKEVKPKISDETQTDHCVKNEQDECKNVFEQAHESLVVVEPKLSNLEKDEKVGDNPTTTARAPSRRKSVLTPIAWQQQFMSFLSTAQEEESFASDDPDFVCHVDISPAKISRRQRSRNIRNSSCSCCIDAESHNKKERQSRQREKKLLREQKHFIQDMLHLVSLRNKIVKLIQTLLPENLKHFVKAETESLDEVVEFILRILRSSGKEKDTEQEESPSTRVCSPNRSQDEDEYMDDEMPVLENCTAYVSNIPSSPPASKFQSLSDSGIVQDQSFTCEATCETISVSVDFSDDQTNTYENVVDRNPVAPDHSQYLGTELAKYKGNCTEIIPDGTHMTIDEDEPEGETSQENGSCANVLDKESISIVGTEPTQLNKSSVSDSAIFHVSDETSAIDEEWNKGDIDRSDDEVTTSDNSANINNVLVLDKLASVLYNSDSKRDLSSRSDPIMGLLADKTCEENPGKNSECAIRNSTPVVKTPSDEFTCDVTSLMTSTACTDQPKDKVIDVFEPSIVLCKKPKKCLKLFMKRIHSLLHRLLPGVHFEHHFFRNSNNLEYLLDAIIQSNQENLSVEV
ncbi:uncharacterized protein LOC133200113 [Saccostrea echinata]|uniref:uncharacterized protein LOC133200113 n=1 Tax=Saccostrea echinata TaxID=191078 RepID=UPI002A8105F8|nr:uncharacterized protein LOC133200113 [Saccostrea echinata]XP_061191841.1 uncharacterized protein LOC133200113 [Saccostrea echinata]